jgi:hypothetical protein
VVYTTGLELDVEVDVEVDDLEPPLDALPSSDRAAIAPMSMSVAAPLPEVVVLGR